MKNSLILALLLSFIVCTHLQRDYNMSLKKSISTLLVTTLQSLNTKTFTNYTRMDISNFNSITNTTL
jgi:hypothetical protein